ncbi:MAG: Zn-ribbon domain-containing OB-fold protein [Methanomassiliicoccales archaeon]
MAPKKFRKFREVMDEVMKRGTAIYRDGEGKEQLIIKFPYSINYIHSYAEDSKFFLGLSQGRLYGSECKRCNYVYGTPRGHCMFCGQPTEWKRLPLRGRVHAWTTCQFGSEAFLKETPYNLVLIEFDGVDSLFMSRLKDCGQEDIYIGMPVVARFAKRPEYLVRDVWFVPEKRSGKRTRRKA